MYSRIFKYVQTTQRALPRRRAARDARPPAVSAGATRPLLDLVPRAQSSDMVKAAGAAEETEDEDEAEDVEEPDSRRWRFCGGAAGAGR